VKAGSLHGGGGTRSGNEKTGEYTQAEKQPEEESMDIGFRNAPNAQRLNRWTWLEHRIYVHVQQVMTLETDLD